MLGWDYIFKLLFFAVLRFARGTCKVDEIGGAPNKSMRLNGSTFNNNLINYSSKRQLAGCTPKKYPFSHQIWPESIIG